jgi:hypothetical protein
MRRIILTVVSASVIAALIAQAAAAAGSQDRTATMELCSEWGVATKIEN